MEQLALVDQPQASRAANGLARSSEEKAREASASAAPIIASLLPRHTDVSSRHVALLPRPLSRFLLQTTLLQLAKEAAEEKRIHDVGGDEPSLRTKSRAQLGKELPLSTLRANTTKMQLRPAEQDSLKLVSSEIYCQMELLGMWASTNLAARGPAVLPWSCQVQHSQCHPLSLGPDSLEM